MKKKFILVIVLLIFLLIVVVGAGSLILKRVPAVTYQVDPHDSRAHWGTISGSLSYPSEAIPAMGVCAETTEKEDLYCTYEMIESNDYTYGLGYKLNVPPGDYYIFSHLVEEGREKIGYTNEDKAYYSKFVTCGMLYECPSHNPIKVEVKTREHITRIDPVDWYDY